MYLRILVLKLSYLCCLIQWNQNHIHMDLLHKLIITIINSRFHENVLIYEQVNDKY